MAMATRSVPMGWHPVPYVNAPDTLAELNIAMRTCVSMPVPEMDADNVFNDAEHMQAFRAWHDSIHYRTQAPFNIAGEAMCAYAHAWALVRQYGDESDTRTWVAMILCMVLGANEFKVRTGEYPTSMRRYVKDYYYTWMQLAAKLCMTFEGDEKLSELGAMRMAQGSWGKA